MLSGFSWQASGENKKGRSTAAAFLDGCMTDPIILEF
jgi:hypothetical protein